MKVTVYNCREFDEKELCEKLIELINNKSKRYLLAELI